MSSGDAPAMPRPPRLQRIVLRRFKRFDDLTVAIPDHVVFAGPNNAGKTTLLQAISAWDFGFRSWLQQRSDYNIRRGGYPFAQLERLAFAPIALPSFEMLWSGRDTRQLVEIEAHVDGRSIPIEFQWDSPGQINVRPSRRARREDMEAVRLRTTFIPAMTGLLREERRLADREAIDDLLAQGRAGEVLRNLLVLANADDFAWTELTATIDRLFKIRLEHPATGALIRAEYTEHGSNHSMDLAGAGSGFLQVLLLLTLMLTRRGDILLLDEPDAHLHMILQQSVYGEIRRVAAVQGSQLLIATHSEKIIEAVDPARLCLMVGTPRALADTEERRRLIQSLSALGQPDVVALSGARGVLYVEDFTDLDMLKTLAEILDERAAFELLTTGLLVKRSQAALPDGLGLFRPADHWAMLKLVRPTIHALELVDGDNRNRAADVITGDDTRLQRLRWRRYEIESYLLHPDLLCRFAFEVGGAQSAQDMRAHIEDTWPPTAVKDPLGDNPFFNGVKAREQILPPALAAAGIVDLPYTEYFRIARSARPDEIPGEVREKLRQLCQAYGVRP